jgi:cytochrome d ubiquinol oxidase subunit II
MQQCWFWIISLMITLYAVLDGFDFGAGALHLFVAKTDTERQQVLRAIGPFWDGNEVWLLAAGGALLVAFPPVLAAAFSGFYLALFVLIWTLILRGISIEFRSHVQDNLWHTFWDAVFSLSSALIPILLGAALGNVLRGVPLAGSVRFHIALFTHFRTFEPVGILDWYTVLIGVFVFLTVVGHGAAFLAWRTTGAVQRRAHALGVPVWAAIAALGLVATLATARVNPALYENLRHSPMGWLGVTLFAASVFVVFFGLVRRLYLVAFVASSTFIAGMLVATAACTFPVMLRSSINDKYSLTAYNAASDAHGLQSAALWWIIGFPLAVGYAALLFYLHRKPKSSSGTTL